ARDHRPGVAALPAGRGRGVAATVHRAVPTHARRARHLRGRTARLAERDVPLDDERPRLAHALDDRHAASLGTAARRGPLIARRPTRRWPPGLTSTAPRAWVTLRACPSPISSSCSERG